jgi:hypothetical protein
VAVTVIITVAVAIETAVLSNVSVAPSQNKSLWQTIFNLIEKIGANKGGLHPLFQPTYGVCSLFADF